MKEAEGGKRVKLKFLDIVHNGYASENNPRRIGIFIRRSGRDYQMTDGKGSFWLSAGDNDKLTVMGNLLTNPEALKDEVKT